VIRFIAAIFAIAIIGWLFVAFVTLMQGCAPSQEMLDCYNDYELIEGGEDCGYYRITAHRWDGESVVIYRYMKTVDGKRYMISKEEYLEEK